MVKISYFTNLGTSAYAAISRQQDDLFASLAAQFVTMMDILQSVRVYSNDHQDLSPLDAYDLWNETQSIRAFHLLTHGRSANPVTSIVQNVSDKGSTFKK